MVTHLSCIIILLHFHSQISSAANITDGIVRVVTFFRHGQRSPIQSYEFYGKPENTLDLWPEGSGQLVQEGKQQLYTLGKRLRERYEDFLFPLSYAIENDLKIVSTPSERCFQSAECLLAGFVSSSEDEIWSDDLVRQPVPILSSADRIKILSNAGLCPKYDEQLKLVVNMVNVTDANVRYLINLVSERVTSKKIETVPDLFFVADYFNTKTSFMCRPPKWISKVNYTSLLKFHRNSMSYLTHSFLMCRLLAGPLITDLVVRMHETVYKSPDNSKFYFYSGHDSSLHSLASCLGINLQFIPNFGASLSIEFYKFSPTDFRLKLIYSNTYDLKRLKVLKMPGCDELCPFGRFFSLVEKYIITDSEWIEECSLN